MSISANDIKFYKSANNNDTDGNGGAISSTLVVSSTLNNLFPNVTSAERVAGKTRYRKEFMRNESVDDFTLELTELWIGSRSTGGDHFQIKGGSDVDVQSAADDYTNWYGAGVLSTTVGSGESSLEVTFDTTSGVFSGESLFLHVDDGINEARVQVVGTPSWIGNTATINISGELNYNFALTDTIVSTILDIGNIETSSNTWTENTVSGSYDEATYPVALYNVGTIKESWTLTFDDGVSFEVTGAVTGSVGSGSVSSNFVPANDSSYYFAINKDGWGGTWASGETITFNTVHAGQGVWVKEIVPAGISSQSNNTVRLDWAGESA